MPRWSPPPAPPHAPQLGWAFPRSTHGLWLVGRVLAGAAVGVVVLSATRHLGVPGIEALHAHAGLWDGAALLVGYALVAGSTALTRGRTALARSPRADRDR